VPRSLVWTLYGVAFVGYASSLSRASATLPQAFTVR
jgi:hypothetical protein